MASIFSKQAPRKAIAYSKEVYDMLLRNKIMMDEKVNIQFIGLNDPTYVSYLELSLQMQELIGQIGLKLEAITNYCEDISRKLDNYTEI